MPRKTSSSPNPIVYGNTPLALEREVATDRQIRWDEETLIWGDSDDLPLRILDAVNKSGTTTACLSKTERFIKGSGFTDESLMQLPIDKDGTTLWQLHCQLAPYMALLEGFAVNLKFNQKGKITFAYAMGVESCRFVKVPKDKNKKIDQIKFNPYFGTREYNADYTQSFPVYDISKAKTQVQSALDSGGKYGGQVYFFGTVRPPYKFYPVPKYWSGQDFIYVDAGIGMFHKENQANGFFQSSLITVVGNPDAKSKNPEFMKEIVQTDGSKKLIPDKSVGEEFDAKMSKQFSGVRKAGTAMVMWAQNKDQAPSIQSFPVNSQFDVLAGTYNDAIKGICIATDVDPMLLSIQNNGLSNAGDSLRAVIENQQSKVTEQQKALEDFYNNVLLANLETKTEARVKIKNYSPVSLSVTVEDRVWDVLSDSEKKKVAKQLLKDKGLTDIIEDDKVVVDEETGEPLTPVETQLNEKIADLSGIQIIRMQSIARKYGKGEITIEQAKLLLKNFGLDDVEINTWLGIEAEAPTE